MTQSQFKKSCNKVIDVGKGKTFPQTAIKLATAFSNQWWHSNQEAVLTIFAPLNNVKVGPMVR